MLNFMASHDDDKKLKTFTPNTTQETLFPPIDPRNTLRRALLLLRVDLASVDKKWKFIGGGSTSQWSKWRFLIIYEEALSEYYIHDYYCLCGAYEKKKQSSLATPPPQSIRP